MNLLKAIGDRLRGGPNVYSSHGLGVEDYDYHLASDETIAKYQKTATVFTCADLIAKSIAQVDFTCDDSFWNNAFDRPNEYQSRYDFFYSLAWDALIFGNAYVWKSYRNRASKGTLSLLESSNVIPSGRTNPKYRIEETGEEFGPTRILHLRHGGGSDVKAIGRLHASMERVKALISCDKEINDVFQNGVSAQYVISGPAANEDQLKKMTSSVRKSFGSNGQRRGGIVALEGGFKLDKLPGITPADGNLRDLRTDLIREIAAIFGVPPFAVGGASDTKFTNTVARHQQTNSYALMPLAENIKSKFSHSLNVNVDFSEESIINSDFAMKLDFAIQAAGGSVLTPDEAREGWLHKPPAPGGDGSRLRAGWTEDRNSAAEGGDDEGREPLDEDDGDEADE